MSPAPGGRTSLAIDDLFASAPDQWALAAPDGSDRRAWLHRLTASLESEARLSAFGRYLAREDLLRGAAAVATWVGRHGGGTATGSPSSTPGPVVVIGGLPRTGTTLLHLTAAATGDAWVPRTWEYDHPALVGATGGPARDEAVADSAARLDVFARLAPGFDAIHPMGATMPEECDVLFAHRFESFRPLVLHDLPGYRAAWLGAPHDTAYALWADVVRLAASGRLAVLKSPGHLDGYTALRAQLPATIVQIYRPVSEVLASWVSLVARARRAYARDVADRETLLHEWLATFSDMVDRGLAARSVDPSGWVGVDYGALTADPTGTWAAILAEVGLVGGRARAAPPRRRGPGHAYERSLPAGVLRRVVDLDDRYRALVFG